MKREWWVLVLVVGAVGAFFATTQLHDAELNVDMRDMGPLEIREDTTRLLEPVSGGLIDYVGVINAARPADAENAAIPLLQILGTGFLVEDAAEVVRELRADADLTTTGVFVAPSPEVTAALEETLLLKERASSSVLSAWVEDNRQALDALVLASRRPSFWLPALRSPETGGLTDMPRLSEALGPVCDALQIRAELARVAGRTGNTWRDLEALLRLYALVDQAPGQLSRFSAERIQSKAVEGLRLLFNHSPPGEELARRMLDVLSALPPSRGLAGDIDQFERYFILDTVIQIAGGADAHGINPALCAINEAFDEVVELLQDPDGETLGELQRHVLARAVAGALGDDVRGLVGRLRRMASTVSGGANEMRLSGQAIARRALAVVAIALSRIQDAEGQHHVLLLATALRLHELRTGDYPATLAGLVPGTLPALPVSAQGAAPVGYERFTKGCDVQSGGAQIQLARER